jgi:radical SAM protein (TIGR01212 family)
MAQSSLRATRRARLEDGLKDSRYNRHADRLIDRHGGRVWRLGLDGGFGCPNRPPAQGGGQARSPGGCVYCAASASRAVYLAEGPGGGEAGGGEPGSPAALASLERQVGEGLAFLRRRYEARRFFPYFQAYSSTNAPPAALAASYDLALSAIERAAPGSARGLVVSTRPDCVDEAVVSLLASYAARGLEVWVELGLQSGRDATLARLNRGHDVASFTRAALALGGAGLRVAAHLILGLPGEDREAMLEGPRLLARLGVAGVKFHDLQVARTAALAGDFLGGELVLLSPPSYLEALADAIELLPPGCEILRIGTDIDAADRLFPQRPPDKTQLYAGLDAVLAARGSRQGSRYAGTSR